MSGSKSSFMGHDSVTASEGICCAFPVDKIPLFIVMSSKVSAVRFLLDIGLHHIPRQKYRKGDRTRRMWVEREEEILATSLLGLVATG